MEKLKGKLTYQEDDEDELWTPIACPHHQPLQEVSADNQPVYNKDGTPKLLDASEFGPVGYQPDCPSCVTTLNDTLDHRDMVVVHRKRAERRG